MLTALKKRLVEESSAPYASTGRFNHGWARGKLSHDPMFMGLLQHRLIPDGAHVVDLGCGRGLLAAWLLAAERQAQRADWPPTLHAPSALTVCGVELMAREAECGNSALQPLYGHRVQLSGGDMRTADLSRADVVTVLDVLHYIPFDDQESLVRRIRAALPVGGRLITRVGDLGSGVRFRVSQWVDAVMWYAQGHRLPRSWCRSVEQWVGLLQRCGFDVQSLPMSQGTPFANVLLVGHRNDAPVPSAAV